MKKNKNIIYIILAALLFWTIWIFVKLIWSSVHFMVLNFYRVFFGFLFLLLVLPIIDKKTFRISTKDTITSAFIGLIMAVSISLYTTANLYAPVQNVVLINYSYPFFLLIFAYFLLKEKITHTKIITLIIAIIWLIIINPFQIWEWSLGNMLALWAAFVFSFLVAYMRKIDWKHTIGIVLWFFFFSFLILSPSVFIWWLGDIQSNRYYILPLWLFSTGLAYLFYNLALEKIEAEISSIIAMIVSPLSAIIFAYFILSEWINIKTIIWWSLLIFAGIYLEMHNKWGNK